DSRELEPAASLYERAKALAEELGMRPLIAHCHVGLGKLYRRAGKQQEGQEHLTIATTMYREMDMRFYMEQAAAKSRRDRQADRQRRIRQEGPSLPYYCNTWLKVFLACWSMGGRGEPVPRDDVVQPVGMAVGQTVFRRQFGEGAGFRRVRGQQAGEFAEVALETAGNDDFDHPTGHVTGVPHGVHLPAGLDDVAARPENYLAVVRSETDLALEHDRVLVLPAVHVRSGDHTNT